MIKISILANKVIVIVFAFVISMLVGYASSIEKLDNPLFQLVDKGTMKASWYGPGFHGRTTANGEIYNMYEFTAAHKSLKFGTLLKITNPGNDSSIVVRINDRGPYVKGRQLDVSKATAMKLGFIKSGVVKLLVSELVKKDTINAEI